MRKIVIGVTSLLILTGCGDRVEAALNETCTNVMADPDIQRSVAEANITADMPHKTGRQRRWCALARIRPAPATIGANGPPAAIAASRKGELSNATLFTATPEPSA